MKTYAYNGASNTPTLYSVKNQNQFYIYNDSKLTKINTEEPLYKFGAIADVHRLEVYSDSLPGYQKHFHNAIEYLTNQGCEFLCLPGDLTTSYTTGEWNALKSYIDNSPIPIYASNGNHDYLTIDSIETYTGHPFRYTLEKHGDLFVFIGVRGYSGSSTLNSDDIDWLSNIFSTNAHKRIFLFCHARPTDGCGNINGIYPLALESTELNSLLRIYKNVIYFHGHSHLKLEFGIKYGDSANYDNKYGRWNIHTPAIVASRDGGVDDTPENIRSYVLNKSQCYIVEVYHNKIVLIGKELGEYEDGARVPSSNYAYNIGDMILKDGVLYKSTINTTTYETWNPAHWELVGRDYIVKYELPTMF